MAEPSDGHAHLARLTRLLRRRFRCVADPRGGCIGDCGDGHDAELLRVLEAAERFVVRENAKKAGAAS